MSVIPNYRWFETSHHELGHVYYYMAYSRPEIPVVAMSGAFDGGFLEVARAMGAAAVIQKPFTPDQVVSIVGRVLGQPLTPSH